MISIMKQNGAAVYGLVEYVIDFAADKANLPTQGIAPGSTAICIENSSVYILDNSGVWQEL